MEKTYVKECEENGKNKEKVLRIIETTEKVSRIVDIIVFSSLALMLIGLVALIIVYAMKWENIPAVRYDMQPLQDDTYLIVYEVSSNVPANNYTVGKVCINNQVLTVKGSVNITYISKGTPYCEYKESNCVNGDRISVYLYPDNVLYQSGQSLGR